MNINEASLQTGISKDMIRFYEKKGLINPKRNDNNNYRDYTVSDLHTLIIIKQYSALGIELNNIINMLQDNKLNNTISLLSEQLTNLQDNALYAHLKYLNALDLYTILDKVNNNINFDIGQRQQQYYYPNYCNHKSYTYSNLYISAGVARPVYRIKQQYLYSKQYPQDIGLLLSTPIKEEKYDVQIIQPYTYYRIVTTVSKNHLISNKQIINLSKQILKDGYQLSGDIYIYQLIASNQHDKDTICVEFTVK